MIAMRINYAPAIFSLRRTQVDSFQLLVGVVFTIVFQYSPEQLFDVSRRTTATRQYILRCANKISPIAPSAHEMWMSQSESGSSRISVV